ncbi:MAG: hypothetical protein SFU27_05065 [Thermonemataceae bacterium]|nr:hypothetical protein [Thermonemataceae bacterium]
MKNLKYLFVIVLMLGANADSFGQGKIESFFRTEEKFYVVVAVLALIMLGILLFVFRLDKKISDIEKNNKQKN